MGVLSLLRASAGALGCGALLACNLILGIDSASPEPIDASHPAEDGPSLAGDGNADGAGMFVYAQDYAINCDNYCTLMMEACPPLHLNNEYLSADVCKDICKLSWDPSSEALDPANEPMPPDDTFACRVWHANAALEGYPANDPHTHCPHAGPLGGNHCDAPGANSYCIPFCKLELAVCAGDNAQYSGMDDCLAACLPTDAGYAGFAYWDDPLGSTSTDLVTSGNTVNCRLYHLENGLYTGDLATHCVHTNAAGGNTTVGFFCAGDAGN